VESKCSCCVRCAGEGAPLGQICDHFTIIRSAVRAAIRTAFRTVSELLSVLLSVVLSVLFSVLMSVLLYLADTPGAARQAERHKGRDAR
jgi:hypothetical protein